jgi:hypothetical protein
VPTNDWINPHREPNVPRLMLVIALSLAAAVLAAPAGGADMPVQGKPPGSANVHAYGDMNPSCQVWTDGCRRCTRANGTPNCSNIGIACQPGIVRCVAEPESKK